MFLAFPYMQMNEAGKPENQTDRQTGWGKGKQHSGLSLLSIPFRKQWQINMMWEYGVWRFKLKVIRKCN